VLDLARAGQISTTIERFRLDQAPEAYARLRGEELRGCAVVCP